MNSKADFEKIARTYRDVAEIRDVLGAKSREEISVDFLAQGEYNINFLLTGPKQKAVLRLNTGSQMHLDNQIAYEFRTLEILQHTGVTPRPFFLDDSRRRSPYGVLVMEYLPGRWLEYEKDYLKAADVLARIHAIRYFEESGLIATPNPAQAILEECEAMAQQYHTSPLGDRAISDLIRRATDRVRERVSDFSPPADVAGLVLNNTEVNSSNFLVDESAGSVKLVDWEKAVFSVPAQDISHFLVPTTTYWKSDFFFSPEQIEAFLRRYGEQTGIATDVLEDQLRIFWPLTCLRGVSWCAMAYIEYLRPDRILKNSFAFKKIQAYLNGDFIKWVFRDILSGGRASYEYSRD